MAKDPAMLWYWGDWFSGTSLLSRFLKGCYMDLLHAHFNSGRLSLEEIKICLGSDFGQSWPTLQKKFKQDETGLFFNERLETEKKKRQEYCSGRGGNRKGKKSHDDTHDFHMNNHMENGNGDVSKIKKGVQGETQPQPTGGYLIDLMLQAWMGAFPEYFYDEDDDKPALMRIATKICKQKGIPPGTMAGKSKDAVVEVWKEFVAFIVEDTFFQKLNLVGVDRQFSGVNNSLISHKKNNGKITSRPAQTTGGKYQATGTGGY